MLRLAFIDRVLHVVFAILALVWFRREREHLVLAAYVTWMALWDIVLPILRRFYPLGVYPLHGAQRVLVHVSDTIVLSWTFLFLAVCLHYFVRRGALVAIAAWCLASIASWIAYVPDAQWTRGLTFVSLGGVAVTWASIGWGIFWRRDIKVQLAHLIVILYAGTDVAVHVLPYSNVLRDWQLMRIANTVLYSVCIAAHAWSLYGRTRSSRPAVVG